MVTNQTWTLEYCCFLKHLLFILWHGTFISSISSCLPAWIESYPLSLFQEINQRHRDEPLRTWRQYDGNHTCIQDKLHQVINIYSYRMTSIFYSIIHPFQGVPGVHSWRDLFSRLHPGRRHHQCSQRSFAQRIQNSLSGTCERESPACFLEPKPSNINFS